MNRQERAPLGLGQTLAYCLYAIPLIATTGAISTFIPPYYSQALGMPLAMVATSLVMIRLIDAICDPVIGLAVDHAPFRQKHRPWLLIALPLYLTAVVLLFFPAKGLIGSAYLIATGGLVYIAFTIAQVVHQAWAASLERDPRRLSRLFGLREVAVIAGVLGVFAVAALASHLQGGDVAVQARAAGIFILVTITVATLVTWAFTPDSGKGDMAHGDASWAVLRPFLLSRDFILLSLAMLVYNSAWTAMGAMGFFVAQHLYRAPEYFALSLVLTFAIAPFGMIGWMKLAGRWGDRATLRFACLFLASAIALLPLATRFGLSGLIAVQILMGLGFGAGPYLLRSITGVLANAYIARTGCEVRGAAFAMINFFDKLGSGLGAAALLPLALLGFDPKGAVDDHARHVLLVIATAAPLAGFVIAACLINALKLAPQPDQSSVP
ncbi:MAG: MFS transporter [Sphingomonadales bacterium]|nr:MFS transporter [Sphingomonadales bacterium]